MLTTLIKKEILNNVLNLRFSLAYVLCVFLLVGGSSIMLSDYLEEQRAYVVSKNIYHRQTLEMRNPGEYMWTPKSVPRTPLITKIFAMGAERDPDIRAEVQIGSHPYFKGDFKRNPMVNLFPSLDMIFTVGVIFSLLIFVLTFDFISGERDQGTLKVLLSCPLPRDKLIAAKWIGGYLSLVTPFIISCLLIAIIMLFSGGVQVTVDSWIRILILMVFCCLYIAVIFSLSAMVSALFKNSSTSILVLLLVWAVSVIVIPSASTPIAHLAVKAPNPETLMLKLRENTTQGWAQMDSIRTAEMQKKFGTTAGNAINPSQRTDFNTWSRDFQNNFIEEYIITKGRQDADRHYRQTDRVHTVSKWIRRISPYGCLQNASVLIARTGSKWEAGWRNSLEEYQKATFEYTKQATVNSSQGRSRIDVNNAPRPVMPKATLSEDLTQALPDIGVLALMGIIFVMTGFMAFLRMDIL